MPRKDGTGPEGQGPMTGRGTGNCNGNTTRPMYGQGRGGGQSRGRRNGFGAFSSNNPNTKD